ncbi:hypothetical protein [Nitrosophilus alvini]|uniref:hypothetical protein n=1 Tax=Nitrosophilus alvini TaxID=2714855 RepID=UPI00190E4B68|nr:hypothetical protein [Nitrosophilus alvini]
MAFLYIAIILLLVVTLIGIVFILYTDMGKKFKIVILAAALTGWGMIYFYNSYQEDARERHKKILFDYEHGKEIRCGDTVVSKDKFNYVSGTMVFVGKEESEYAGLVVPLDKCKAGE